MGNFVILFTGGTQISGPSPTPVFIVVTTWSRSTPVTVEWSRSTPVTVEWSA